MSSRDGKDAPRMDRPGEPDTEVPVLRISVYKAGIDAEVVDEVLREILGQMAFYNSPWRVVLEREGYPREIWKHDAPQPGGETR